MPMRRKIEDIDVKTRPNDVRKAQKISIFSSEDDLAPLPSSCVHCVHCAAMLAAHSSRARTAACVDASSLFHALMHLHLLPAVAIAAK
jgi:hypothetical protein